MYVSRVPGMFFLYFSFYLLTNVFFWIFRFLDFNTQIPRQRTPRVPPQPNNHERPPPQPNPNNDSVRWQRGTGEDEGGLETPPPATITIAIANDGARERRPHKRPGRF